MSAEGAIEVISQEAPTPWMRLPKFETRLAVQMARKMRCRNGASVEARHDARLSSASAPQGFCLCHVCSPNEGKPQQRRRVPVTERLRHRLVTRFVWLLAVSASLWLAGSSQGVMR
jgi:hypothetical protein